MKGFVVPRTLIQRTMAQEDSGKWWNKREEPDEQLQGGNLNNEQLCSLSMMVSPVVAGDKNTKVFKGTGCILAFLSLSEQHSRLSGTYGWSNASLTLKGVPAAPAQTWSWRVPWIPHVWENCPAQHILHALEQVSCPTHAPHALELGHWCLEPLLRTFCNFKGFLLVSLKVSTIIRLLLKTCFPLPLSESSRDRWPRSHWLGWLWWLLNVLHLRPWTTLPSGKKASITLKDISLPLTPVYQKAFGKKTN